MRGVGRGRGQASATIVMVLATAALAAGPGSARGQSQSGSEQVSSDPKPSGRGETEAPKSPGKTAGEVGDRLHDSAKGFGEALLDGIKYAGNKVINFFGDDKPKK